MGTGSLIPDGESTTAFNMPEQKSNTYGVRYEGEGQDRNGVKQEMNCFKLKGMGPVRGAVGRIFTLERVPLSSEEPVLYFCLLFYCNFERRG